VKVEADIITSTAASLSLQLWRLRQTLSLVLQQVYLLLWNYVNTFKTVVIVFIIKVIMCLTSQWRISYSVIALILTISLDEIKVKISKLPINCQQHIYPVFIYSYNSSGDFQDGQHRIQQMLGLGSSESSAGNSSKPTTPRETIVRHLMNEREVEFTDIKKLK